MVERPIGSPYSAFCPVCRVAHAQPGEGVRVEQVREGPDCVREIHQPIVQGPFHEVEANAKVESEVGRLAGLERRQKLVRSLRRVMEDELDLLAGLLLEGGDDLPERRVLLGVEALLPPHHEVGGPGAERRHEDQRGGKDNGANSQHGRLPEVIAQHTPIAAAPSRQFPLSIAAVPLPPSHPITSVAGRLGGKRRGKAGLRPRSQVGRGTSL